MSTNVRTFRFPVMFDTCDVVYNLSISLLPPIVLDNLFEENHKSFLTLLHVGVYKSFMYFLHNQNISN